jgi:glycosyltransferase involved in cell wall biosynthesis
MSKRLAFVLEHSLGHTTHAQNLKRSLQGVPEIGPTFFDLPYHNTPGWWSRLPGVRANWSVRASLGAYLALRGRTKEWDAALFHTQVTSLFSAGIMRRLPSVISLDATPVQYDALGAAYDHIPSGSARLEAVKKRLNVRAFTSARHLVTWSEWTKESLVSDYGVSPAKVTVIPPGIDTALWNFPARSQAVGKPMRLLFVGADFLRKGGDTLLEAFGRMPAGSATLDIVTKTEGVGERVRGVTVHRGLLPNSDPLRRLYAEADAFVFPTRGDCLPLAVMEALASGLPVVTTRVAALPEAVEHGQTGLLVPLNDPAALADALGTLLDDLGLRLRLGCQARQTALSRFEATANYRRLVETVAAAA